MCRLVEQEQEKLLEAQCLLADRDTAIHQHSSHIQQLQAQVGGFFLLLLSSLICFSLYPFLCADYHLWIFISSYHLLIVDISINVHL